MADFAKLNISDMIGRRMSEILIGFCDSPLFSLCCQVYGSNEPVKLTGISITQKIESEKKIQQVSRQFQDIINGSPAIIFVKDLV